MPVHSNEFENVCFNALLHNLIIKIGEITKIANSKKKKHSRKKITCYCRKEGKILTVNLISHVSR